MFGRFLRIQYSKKMFAVVYVKNILGGKNVLINTDTIRNQHQNIQIIGTCPIRNVWNCQVMLKIQHSKKNFHVMYVQIILGGNNG